MLKIPAKDASLRGVDGREFSAPFLPVVGPADGGVRPCFWEGTFTGVHNVIVYSARLEKGIVEGRFEIEPLLVTSVRRVRVKKTNKRIDATD